MAFQSTEQVKDGDGGDTWIIDGIHVIFSHAAGRDQAKKTSVLLDDGKGGNAVILLVQDFPGMRNRDAGADHGRGVIINIGNLSAYGAEIERGLETEPVQQERGFRIQMTAAGGNILISAEGVLKSGVSHGGYDGIRIRIFMAYNIYRIHRYLLITDSSAQTSPSSSEEALHWYLFFPSWIPAGEWRQRRKCCPAVF